MKNRILVGTRGSRLALAQTRLVTDALARLGGGAEIVVVPLKTSGDSLAPAMLKGMDGKTAFTGDIDRELMEGRIDIAVHSMKDIPPGGDGRVVVGATPERGDPRDALVSPSGATLGQLRKGARIGTSSIRRRAQIMAARPDVEVVELRGNVDTRLRKIEEEGLDGAVLAAAGLARLGLEARVSQAFSVEEVVPAPCQGTLAVEARADDDEVLRLLRSVDDQDTRASSECERAFSGELGGDCNVPLGAFAAVSAGKMRAIGLVADPLGKGLARATAEGSKGDPRALGLELARKVRKAGGQEILERLRS